MRNILIMIMEKSRDSLMSKTLPEINAMILYSAIIIFTKSTQH